MDSPILPSLSSLITRFLSTPSFPLLHSRINSNLKQPERAIKLKGRITDSYLLLKTSLVNHDAYSQGSLGSCKVFLKENEAHNISQAQDSPHAKDAKNLTFYHPEQVGWTWENMPDILYQLNPEGRSNRNEEPPYLPYLIHGRRVRDFPVLPDNISSTVEEFRVEAWMRLDRRIRLKDITDRIHPDFRLRENALQQRGVRFRQAFGLLAWDSGNKRSRELESKLWCRMKMLGLDPQSNSTRGITPGLIDPSAGEVGGRVPVPAGWGPNKSPRCKKAQYIEAELLKKLTPEIDSSEPESPDPEPAQPEPEVVRESTPDPDPSGFEAYMKNIDDPFSEELVEETEIPDPMEYDLGGKTPTSEETHKPVVQVNYSYQYTSYDEYKTHFNGALPVIHGIMADETLPTTVSMADLDLTMGITFPQPEMKLPPLPTLHDLDGQAPIWSSSSALSSHGFCSSSCFEDTSSQPEDLLKPLGPFFPASREPQTPFTEFFDFINPSQVDMTEDLAVNKNDIGILLDEHNFAERQLIEMSRFQPFDSS
ncbi:hypothetical protein BJY01DRAFT_244336 [Aspergillus pseudoustus]|uniref:Uncharacterized protein n=1 Tax=Aspergillus pseudoustus TaxID=1810923 RepID=A0ABR4KKZ7_9EURO